MNIEQALSEHRAGRVRRAKATRKAAPPKDVLRPERAVALLALLRNSISNLR